MDKNVQRQNALEGNNTKKEKANHSMKHKADCSQLEATLLCLLLTSPHPAQDYGAALIRATFKHALAWVAAFCYSLGGLAWETSNVCVCVCVCALECDIV